MYSKDEVSKRRHEFWITLGKYLAPIPSAEGENINWINYRTGIRDISFKMLTKKKSVRIGIFLTHSDKATRHLYFQQFQNAKKLLESTLEEKWDWAVHEVDDNGKSFSSISHGLEGVSVMNKEDWPTIISFFKNRIIGLDQFWSIAKYDFPS